MKYLCIVTISLIIILLPTKGFSPDYKYFKLNLPKEIKGEECSYYLSEIYIYTLGHYESGNNPDTSNVYGYIGLFAFGQSAINHLKLGFTVDEFKKNPKIFPRHKQIASLKKYTNYNKRILRNYIAKYKNTYFNGVYITEHGILAAAHLSGAGGVKRFFNEGYVAKDKNGTTIIKYLELFKNV